MGSLISARSIPITAAYSHYEVYGSLSKTDPAFSEINRYEPNSPYSASKAASNHLARAWHHTYGLPVLTTNCSKQLRALPLLREVDSPVTIQVPPGRKNL
jgi:hypothetical protein